MKTRTITASTRRALPAVLATLALAAATAAHAAVVTWGAAQNITGDSNVSTAGTLVGAFNTGAVGVPPTTVNGVTFQSFAVPHLTFGATVGNFAIASGAAFSSFNTAFGSGSPPFTNLSAQYQTLLRSGIRNGNNGFTLTMSSLTVGTQYAFQWWANGSDLFSFGNFPVVASAGNSVTLFTNPTDTNGGLGQFAIGTFTADATTQAINFGGSAAPNLNAFQLLAVAPVPEPGSALAGLLALGACAGGLFKRNRRAVPSFSWKRAS